MEEDNTPPESGWFYRRWFTFISSAWYMVLITIATIKVDSDDTLKWIVFALVASKIILDGLYMAGASVLDYAKLAAGWKGKNE